MSSACCQVVEDYALAFVTIPMCQLLLLGVLLGAWGTFAAYVAASGNPQGSGTVPEFVQARAHACRDLAVASTIHYVSSW
jgi:hypothetical protein